MIKQAALIATRSDGGDPIALCRMAGLSLIKRVILTFARAQIERVVVVAGGSAARIRTAIEGDRDLAHVQLEVVEVADLAPDGVALLAVRDRLTGSFVVATTNQLHDGDVIKRVAAADLDRPGVHAGVARRAPDAPDAPQVTTDGARIVALGSSGGDCVSAGIYAAGPALLDALEQLRAATGTCTLVDGVRALATAGQAHALELGDAFWATVETAAQRAAAERELFRRLRKRVDGPIARWINRTISISITRLLVNTNVTPNQMTVVATVVGAAGVILVFQATWLTLALGAFLVQMQSVLDGCDGELARLKFKSSRFGEWLDNVLDDQVNVAYGVALGFASAELLGEPAWRWVGLGAGAAFLVHNLLFYAQLQFVHRSGNPFNFRWWFETGSADVTAMLASPKSAAMVLGAIVRALIRRDVFLFAFMALAIARLPQVAVAGYAAIAASQFALIMVHVMMGGMRRRDPVAVAPSA